MCKQTQRILKGTGKVNCSENENDEKNQSWGEILEDLEGLNLHNIAYTNNNGKPKNTFVKYIGNSVKMEITLELKYQYGIW